MASRVSTGSTFPDGAPCEVGEVLILTCEDGPADTLRPRLDKHGADVSKIGNINGIELPNGETIYPSLRDHLKPIERYFETHPNLKLLAIDPISAYLGDRTDSHNNSSVREVLGPLRELAERHKVAILGITTSTRATLRQSIELSVLSPLLLQPEQPGKFPKMTTSEGYFCQSRITSPKQRGSPIALKMAVASGAQSQS